MRTAEVATISNLGLMIAMPSDGDGTVDIQSDDKIFGSAGLKMQHDPPKCHSLGIKHKR